MSTTSASSSTFPVPGDSSAIFTQITLQLSKEAFRRRERLVIFGSAGAYKTKIRLCFDMKQKPRGQGRGLFRTATLRKRPEDSLSASEFYAGAEGDAHRERNALRNIQAKITLRALALLAVAPPAKLLDAGCGSGFSSLVAQAAGFAVSGFDSDKKMVAAARAKGIDARLGDFRKIPFADSSFDAAISVSALQWLGAGRSPKEAFLGYHKSAREFARVLKQSARAVIQFYPRDEKEALLAGKAFKKAGFAVTLQIDSSDNPKKRKIYLVLGNPGRLKNPSVLPRKTRVFSGA
jgi:18S rRNA (guanine1575-N7)-methyltransferase